MRQGVFAGGSPRGSATTPARRGRGPRLPSAMAGHGRRGSTARRRSRSGRWRPMTSRARTHHCTLGGERLPAGRLVGAAWSRGRRAVACDHDPARRWSAQRHRVPGHAPAPRRLALIPRDPLDASRASMVDDEQLNCPDRPAGSGTGGDHRWWRDRRQRRLPPRKAGLDRRRAAGARPAHVGDDLARRRPDRVGWHDHRDVGVDDQVLDRPLRGARGRDRAVDRLQARRLPADGEQPGADAQVAAGGRLPAADGDRT